MPSKLKTAKRDYSSKTIATIINLRELGKLYAQIADHVKLPRSSVVYILNRAAQRPWRPATLDARAQRALICHLEQNPNDILAALVTLKIRTQAR